MNFVSFACLLLTLSFQSAYAKKESDDTQKWVRKLLGPKAEESTMQRMVESIRKNPIFPQEIKSRITGDYKNLVQKHYIKMREEIGQKLSLKQMQAIYKILKNPLVTQTQAEIERNSKKLQDFVKDLGPNSINKEKLKKFIQLDKTLKWANEIEQGHRLVSMMLLSVVKGESQELPSEIKKVIKTIESSKLIAFYYLYNSANLKKLEKIEKIYQNDNFKKYQEITQRGSLELMKQAMAISVEYMKDLTPPTSRHRAGSVRSLGLKHRAPYLRQDQMTQ